MAKKMCLLATAALILAHPFYALNAVAASPLNVSGMTAAQEEDKDHEEGHNSYTLTIENQTGKTITAMYLAVGTDNDWTDAEDVLDEGDDLLDDESIELEFEKDHEIMSAHLADIQAKTDGGEMLFEDLDISEDIAGHYIVLHEDGTATVTPDDDDE